MTFFDYRLEIGRERFALIDPRASHILFELKTPLVYRPEFHAQEAAWQRAEVRVEPTGQGAVRVIVTGAPTQDATGPLTLELLAYPDHIELSAAVTARRALTLAHWNLLEPGTNLNLFHVHREIVEQWTTGADLSTYSYDWQFTPRPSFMLFQRDTVMLGLAARELPQGFGLELSVANQRLDGCQDLVRTYDVPASQQQHADRARKIRHFNPGNLVSLDLGETKSLADVEEHLDMAG